MPYGARRIEWGAHPLRNTEYGIRITLYSALLICILTTSFATVGCRSGGVRVRSWDEAVTFAQAELEAAGDVEGRLEGYAQKCGRKEAPPLHVNCPFKTPDY